MLKKKKKGGKRASKSHPRERGRNGEVLPGEEPVGKKKVEGLRKGHGTAAGM